MESTQENRVWHSGPPPHVGWWNASALRYDTLWRWWNGSTWSVVLRHDSSTQEISYCPKDQTAGIMWNDYWPADARVPRLAPEDFEAGARWVLTRTGPVGFKGQEFTVRSCHVHGLELRAHGCGVYLKYAALPSERFVPRRCIGPQTRWDFPVLHEDRCLETVLDTARGAGAKVLKAPAHRAHAQALLAEEPAIGSRWTHRRDPKKRVFEVLAVTNFSEIVGRQPGHMLDYVMLRHPSGCVTPVSLREFKRTAVPTA